MTQKKPNLDEATLRVLKRVLTMPPKPHEDMKVGRASKKKRDPKGRGSSSKRKTA